MAVEINIDPIVLKGFSIGRGHGMWIIFAISNGLSVPANNENGPIEFYTFEDAKNKCLQMNIEHKIETGN
jgi:hypothetical protein